MWKNRTITTELRITLRQSVGTKVPASVVEKPVGTCIQVLFTRIQNEDRLVPRVTRSALPRYSNGGTRLRPKIRTPKNDASSAKAVKLS